MRELAGLRAFVVEDESSVCFLIEDMLQELGCELAGSAATLDAALRAAREAAFDVALLDVNLGGQLVFPVADVLVVRRLPFLFSTGYGKRQLPQRFEQREVLTKPFSLAQLRQTLERALGAASR